MLSKRAVVQGTLEEYELFAELVSGLDEAQWSAPTRCDGWEVRDVAAHIYGTAHDVLAGTVGGRTAKEEAEAYRHLSPSQLAAELRTVVAKLRPLFESLDDATWAANAPGPLTFTFGEGILALWQESWLHADDIRAALGLPFVGGTGLAATVEHVASELGKRAKWGPARLALEGLPELRVGEANGREQLVSADPHRFVLVATGRLDSVELGLDSEVNIYAG